MSRETPFRGWRIVGVGFATQAVCIGASIASFPIFLLPIMEEFGATNAEVSLGPSLFIVTMTVSGLLVGPLLDRRSIRGIMVGGTLLTAACLAAMSQATGLGQLAVLFGLGLAIGVTSMGPLASSTLAARWFRRSIGRAQGLTNMGGPAGTSIFALASGVAVQQLGWRNTLLLYAALTLLLLPAIWGVVRNKPEDVGQWPDGDDAAAEDATGSDEATWTASALLSEPRFWLLVVPVGILMGISMGWVTHIVSLGADLGIESVRGSAILAAGGAVAITGTLCFGFLADRTDRRVLLWLIMGAHVAAFVLLSGNESTLVFTAIVVSIGFAGGGIMPVYMALISQIFGQASFGLVLGIAGMVMLPVGFAAPPLAGALRDSHGNYDTALLLFACGIALAALLFAGLRPAPRTG